MCFLCLNWNDFCVSYCVKVVVFGGYVIWYDWLWLFVLNGMFDKRLLGLRSYFVIVFVGSFIVVICCVIDICLMVGV